MMDSLILMIILIVQTVQISIGSFVPTITFEMPSSLWPVPALNDEIGLCSYAILGEVLTDEQLKDLKIHERICSLLLSNDRIGVVLHHQNVQANSNPLRIAK